MIPDYDPNQCNDALHVVRVHFQKWDYRAHYDARIHGNCRGSTLLESAVDSFVDHVGEMIEKDGGFLEDPDEDGAAAGQCDLELKNDAGDTLTWEIWGTYDDVYGELRHAVVGVEIIEYSGLEVEAQRERRKAKKEGETCREKSDNV